MAVSQRLLPLRCVICRAKILRLKQTLIPRDVSDVNDDYATFNLETDCSLLDARVRDRDFSLSSLGSLSSFAFSVFFCAKFRFTRALPPAVPLCIYVDTFRTNASIKSTR